MTDIRQELEVALQRAGAELRGAGWDSALVYPLEKLAALAQQPCVVAVVGKVKAGKSSFVNALLGRDLAVVRATEATATINHFVYGVPDPARPVRCHWRNGRTSDEDAAFLDSLQGNDAATLERAQNIHHLEYRLDAPFLRQVTLVDTPGTGSTVGAHEERLQSFLGLSDKLKARTVEESDKCRSDADAVIYILGQVARHSEAEFLDEFRQVLSPSARSFQSLGVMGQVDLSDELMQRRFELCKRIEKQLSEELNTVLPVSSGLERTAQMLREEPKWFEALRAASQSLSAELRDVLLSSETIFMKDTLPGWDLSPAHRMYLRRNLPWMSFVTAMQLSGDPQLTGAEILGCLEEWSGFSALRTALDRRFFERGHLIRAFRTAERARDWLKTLRFKHLPNIRLENTRQASTLTRYLGFMQQMRVTGADQQIKQEIVAFLSSSMAATTGADRLASALDSAEERLSELYHLLEEDQRDQDAILDIEALKSGPNIPFDDGELAELSRLFGTFGRDRVDRLGDVAPALLPERYRYWQRKARLTASSVAQSVAAQAAERYRILFNETSDGVSQ